MSHVEFKEWPMSLILFPMLIGFMSHVDFKKWPCHPVEFKGQGPYNWFLILKRVFVDNYQNTCIIVINMCVCS